MITIGINKLKEEITVHFFRCVFSLVLLSFSFLSFLIWPMIFCVHSIPCGVDFFFNSVESPVSLMGRMKAAKLLVLLLEMAIFAFQRG